MIAQPPGFGETPDATRRYLELRHTEDMRMLQREHGLNAEAARALMLRWLRWRTCCALVGLQAPTLRDWMRPGDMRD